MNFGNAASLEKGGVHSEIFFHELQHAEKAQGFLAVLIQKGCRHAVFFARMGHYR